MAGRSKTAQQAFEIAEPYAKEMGLDLVDAEYKKEGQGMYLRLFVDRKGGVSIDECEAFSRVIDPIFDEQLKCDADFFEVSSPGLLRPLQNEADYRRYSDEMIDVSLFAAIDGKKNFTGAVKECSGKSVTFEVDGETLEVEYQAISKAVRHIEF